MANGSVVVVGGTVGLGRELAQAYADEGREVVVTGRDQGRAEEAASEIGGRTRGLGFDLAEPHTIADALADVGAVDHLVLAAIERDVNKVREYDIAGALRLVTLKLVGYTEVIHALLPAARGRLEHPHLRRSRPRSSLPGLDDGDDRQRRRDQLGAHARDRARADPGQRAAPGDRRRQPAVDRHAGQSAARRWSTRTPIGRLVTMAEVVGACRFLLENQAINGINLSVDGGWMCM